MAGARAAPDSTAPWSELFDTGLWLVLREFGCTITEVDSRRNRLSGGDRKMMNLSPETNLALISARFIVSSRMYSVRLTQPNRKAKVHSAMKIKDIVCATSTVGLLVGLLVTSALAEDKLEAEAKVSKADATKTALAKVPGGEVKESELEKEHGKLIWSFDITTKGSADITEVNVDAITGEVASVSKESATHEAKEEREEAQEKARK